MCAHTKVPHLWAWEFRRPRVPPLQGGGKTALQVAAEKGHAEVVEKLLKGNASVDVEDKVCAHASVGSVLRLYGC